MFLNIQTLMRNLRKEEMIEQRIISRYQDIRWQTLQRDHDAS